MNTGLTKMLLQAGEIVAAHLHVLNLCCQMTGFASDFSTAQLHAPA